MEIYFTTYVKVTEVLWKKKKKQQLLRSTQSGILIHPLSTDLHYIPIYRFLLPIFPLSFHLLTFSFPYQHRHSSVLNVLTFPLKY